MNKRLGSFLLPLLLCALPLMATDLPGTVTLGEGSGQGGSTGAQRTALGYYSGWQNPYNNSTTLGYLASASASNQVVLGNASVTEVQAGSGGKAFIRSGGLIPGVSLSTDTVPLPLILSAQHAYPKATVNTSGANLYLASGSGTKTFTIVSNATLATKTVTLTASGVLYTLTASAGAPGAHQFQVGTNDTAPQLAVTATNLAAAIAAEETLTGLVTPKSAAAVVSLALAPTCYSVVDGAGTAGALVTATSGADGAVILSNAKLSLGTQQLAVPGVLFTQTADAVTTANTATTLFSTGVGTLTLPANTLVVGRTIEITMGGYVSVATGGAVHALVLSLGGVTVATGVSGVAMEGILNDGWVARATITCRTAGAGGTVVGGATFRVRAGSSSNIRGIFAQSTGTAAADTTGALVLNLTLNNGAATGTYTTQYAVVTVLN